MNLQVLDFYQLEKKNVLGIIYVSVCESVCLSLYRCVCEYKPPQNTRSVQV